MMFIGGCSQRFWYDQPMQKASFILLLAGFVVGYGVVFTWTKDRAPEVVRGMARIVPRLQPGEIPPPPPPDPAVVQSLTDRVKENPKDFDALIELGNIDFDQSKFTEASVWYEKALAVEPDNPNIHADLGTTYFYAQRIDESIVEFQKSLAIDPTHPQALYNIGVAQLHGKNNAQAALEMWQKLVDAHPTYPRIDVVKQQIEALKTQLKK